VRLDLNQEAAPLWLDRATGDSGGEIALSRHVKDRTFDTLCEGPRQRSGV